MTNNFKLRICCVIFIGLVAAGCSQETKLSAEQEKAFKGGPIPPEVKASLNKAMADASRSGGARAPQKGGKP